MNTALCAVRPRPSAASSHARFRLAESGASEGKPAPVRLVPLHLEERCSCSRHKGKEVGEASAADVKLSLHLFDDSREGHETRECLCFKRPLRRSTTMTARLCHVVWRDLRVRLPGRALDLQDPVAAEQTCSVECRGSSCLRGTRRPQERGTRFRNRGSIGGSPTVWRSGEPVVPRMHQEPDALHFRARLPAVEISRNLRATIVSAVRFRVTRESDLLEQFSVTRRLERYAPLGVLVADRVALYPSGCVLQERAISSQCVHRCRRDLPCFVSSWCRHPRVQAPISTRLPEG